MRITAASAHEWENCMRLRVASLDLEQAFDRVTPRLLFDAMVDSATRPTLAASFQVITFDDVGFDRSIKRTT